MRKIFPIFGVIVITLLFLTIGCKKKQAEKPFPFPGTYNGICVIENVGSLIDVSSDTSNMTLVLDGKWAPGIDGEDGWNVTGTATVFIWNNATIDIDGYYSPSTGIEFTLPQIGNYFFGVEGATHSGGTISGSCVVSNQSGVAKRIGTFETTK